jgi:hypothetical protein
VKLIVEVKRDSFSKDEGNAVDSSSGAETNFLDQNQIPPPYLQYQYGANKIHTCPNCNPSNGTPPAVEMHTTSNGTLNSDGVLAQNGTLQSSGKSRISVDCINAILEMRQMTMAMATDNLEVPPILIASEVMKIFDERYKNGLSFYFTYIMYFFSHKYSFSILPRFD